MVYVPKVAHTNFSLAYPLNLFSPEKSLGHRQHPSTLSCLELAFLVDTTCISLFSISVRRCFFIGNPRVIHIDFLYHHKGSLWTQNRGLLPVCDEGCSLVFHSVCSPVGSSGVPAGWWKFSVSFMWSIHRHLLILILGVDLFSSSLLSVSSQSI